MVLFSGLSMAQTTITLPAACATCPSTTSPSTNGTGAVSSYGAPSCTANTINGTMTAGSTIVSGVTMSLYANVTTLGTYNLSSTQNGVTFSGTGTFTALGCQLVTLTASGTPTTAGATTWSTNSTPTGSASATVAAAGPPSYTCGGSTTLVVDVTNPITGRTWMDRNLGASQVATSSTDAASYGDLFQWGRSCDGHQLRTSLTTTTNATTAVPNAGNSWDGLFIIETDSPFDWLTPQNNSLWLGVSGTNNPCPSGYRLPTKAEWNTETASWSSQNSAGAFASPLKLTVAGRRQGNSGALAFAGSNGEYWMSYISISTSAEALSFGTSSLSVSLNARANGASVRCLKD
jgi:uncharacterized protein (TIGR02145 family)